MDTESFLESLKPSTMSLGLDRIRAMISTMSPAPGNNNILVAGTNGKGSTSAFLSSILDRVRGPVGLFTSPHLVSVHERIRLSGVPISREDLESIVSELAMLCGEMDEFPTYFEFLTAAAIRYFERSGTIFNVMEVGLGGRLDATNILNGDLVLISRIDRDHTRILGSTLAEITHEKAGIIKERQKVVVAPQRPSVLRQIRKHAEALNAEVFSVQDLVRTRVCSMDADGLTLDMKLPGLELRAHSRLTGHHQVENMATAVLAASIITRPTPETIQRALAATHWPGRLEYFSNGHGRFLMDGAHNGSGARMLRKYLKAVPVERPLRLVYGGFQDKNPERMLGMLAPLADSIHLVPLPSLRSWDRNQMKKAAEKLNGRVRVTMSDHLSDVLLDSSRYGTNLITGSLYIVGETLKCLNRSPWHLITQDIS